MNTNYLLCLSAVVSFISISVWQPPQDSKVHEVVAVSSVGNSVSVEAVASEAMPSEFIEEVDEPYPRGKVFPFMGFSGSPERDVNHGFSVAGPTYASDQRKSLEAAERAGLKFPFTISVDMNFNGSSPGQPLDLSVQEIKRRITKQVNSVAARKSICWWYLGPEELRHWRKNEMVYMQAATEAIREADPLKRPIWMYEPNHRNAASLNKTAKFLDIVGKGSYTNLTGYREQRIWVRWSMEQQVEAINTLKASDDQSRIPLVLPELCADPSDPSLDHLIPHWVRHDVYLGLMSGGKGVAVWSLFPRKAVSRTWQIWYDAYAHVAIELTGPQQLGQVFLFGELTETLQVRIANGPPSLTLVLGQKNEVEAATTSKSEGESRKKVYPTMTVKEYQYDGSTYVFLCNSSSTNTLEFVSKSLPVGASVVDAFTQKAFSHTTGTLRGWLKPLEVKCFKVTGQ